MKLPEKLKNYENIIIYGAGKRGKLVAEVLCRKYPELPFYGAAISSGQKSPYFVFGKPVYFIE